MITAHRLTKTYGPTTAVEDVTFQAVPGRVTGLLGPNGAGKSTTMRLLLGLDTPTSGSALIKGAPYRSLPSPLRQVGAQFDGSGAHPGRTAQAHLRWAALAGGIDRGRIPEVLARVGLSSAARTRVGRFSLGMGQRLGIATALLGDPGVLVFDEPMNGLDAEGIVWIRTLLRSLADEGRTVLVSSHLMGEMQAVADDLVVIARGRVLRHGAAQELIAGHGSLESAYFAWTAGRGEHAGSTAEGERA